MLLNFKNSCKFSTTNKCDIFEGWDVNFFMLEDRSIWQYYKNKLI